MRSMFFVGCKLLGLYFLYWGINYLISLIPTIGAYKSVMEIPDDSISIYVTVIISNLIIFGFAYGLLFRTEWLARILKIEPEYTETSLISGNEVLRIGIILMGIFLITTRVGRIIWVFYEQNIVNERTSIAATYPKGLMFTKDLLEPGITIVVSLILVFGSRFLAKLIYKSEEESQ